MEGYVDDGREIFDDDLNETPAAGVLKFTILSATI